MELLGFYYEKAAEKLSAEGKPISRELLEKGYVQKDNYAGVPRWYVKPCKVWVVTEVNGVRKNFNIYDNIRAIYPERKRITLQFARQVICQIIDGRIELVLRDGKPFLKKKEVKPRGRAKKK